jgi:hypothetical protein
VVAVAAGCRGSPLGGRERDAAIDVPVDQAALDIGVDLGKETLGRISADVGRYRPLPGFLRGSVPASQEESVGS